MGAYSVKGVTTKTDLYTARSHTCFVSSVSVICWIDRIYQWAGLGTLSLV